MKVPNLDKFTDAELDDIGNRLADIPRQLMFYRVFGSSGSVKDDYKKYKEKVDDYPSYGSAELTDLMVRIKTTIKARTYFYPDIIREIRYRFCNLLGFGDEEIKVENMTPLEVGGMISLFDIRSPEGNRLIGKGNITMSIFDKYDPDCERDWVVGKRCSHVETPPPAALS